MRVVVCHRQRALVQLARLNAERHGVRVEVCANGRLVLEAARRERPDLIVLGNDLKNPTTDETVAMLNADPSLKGVRVVIAKGGLDLGLAKKFDWGDFLGRRVA